MVIRAPTQSTVNGNDDDDEFSSDELWSESSSSENENVRIGYVGPPNPRKRRRRRCSGKNMSEEIKWEVGQKFVNMGKFIDMVRKYGIDERRVVQFVTNV